MTTVIRDYYTITKPGIVYGNTMVAVAGYFFGASGNPLLSILFALVIGIGSVIASACVFNNILDRSIDLKMSRTQDRALVAGRISVSNAALFASLLLITGFTILVLAVSALAAFIAIFGHIAYVVLYGFAKRHSVHGTLVGTISGSTPPVIGYVAATGNLDIAAVLLYLLLVFWQMPHFYAIALFRKHDYESAKIPVLPVVGGIDKTKHQMILYTILFLLACTALWGFGYTSILWLLIMLLGGGYWLYICIGKENVDSTDVWARKQFRWSLVVILLLSFSLSLDGLWH